jgi:o-succinylbenzoate synthase
MPVTGSRAWKSKLSETLVHSVAVERCRIPLKNPYRLSYGSLSDFDLLISRLELDDGRHFVGEVVPLSGYGSETIESITNTVEELVPTICGRTLESSRGIVADHVADAPNASSLLLSAIDTALQEGEPDPGGNGAIPLVYAVSPQDEKLRDAVRWAIQQGYATIKVKIGSDFARDVASVQTLGEAVSPGVRIRFDANQAYTLDQAGRFLEAAESGLGNAVELVEQPMSADAWDEMAELATGTRIPLMLDESIWTLRDIDQAALAGCRWVKLKLCKQGGVRELVRFAEYAVERGLRVVLGNGVATDISNMLELRTYDRYRHLFAGACESNGFAKMERPLKYENLRVKSGKAVW